MGEPLGRPDLAKEAKRTHLQQQQRTLVTDAHAALATPNFFHRNERMAVVTARVSGGLAAESIGEPGRKADLQEVFLRAARVAGKEFAPAFSDAGTPLKDTGADQYSAAQKVAGGIALMYLPDALTVAGIQVEEPSKLVSGTTFDQVVNLTAAQLEVPADLSLTASQVKASLHNTAQGDYFEDAIDSLPFASEGQGELSVDETKALDIGVRLANATWLVGQVHRAAWEENDSRIDPAKREAFNPYDHLKQEQYDRLIDEGKSPQEALVRVAFEVWKDVIELKKAAATEQ